MVQTFLPILQLVLTFGNIVVLLVAFGRFLGKPHKSLEEKYKDLEDRVEKLELNDKMIGSSLENDKNKFVDLYDTTEVILQSILALVEFEVNYCQTEHKDVTPELSEAKRSLQALLVKRSRSTYV